MILSSSLWFRVRCFTNTTRSGIGGRGGVDAQERPGFRVGVAFSISRFGCEVLGLGFDVQGCGLSESWKSGKMEFGSKGACGTDDSKFRGGGVKDQGSGSRSRESELRV